MPNLSIEQRREICKALVRMSELVNAMRRDVWTSGHRDIYNDLEGVLDIENTVREILYEAEI